MRSYLMFAVHICWIFLLKVIASGGSLPSLQNTRQSFSFLNVKVKVLPQYVIFIMFYYLKLMWEMRLITKQHNFIWNYEIQWRNMCDVIVYLFQWRIRKSKLVSIGFLWHNKMRNDKTRLCSRTPVTRFEGIISFIH